MLLFAHSRQVNEILETLQTSPQGLELTEVDQRLQQYGRNILPKAAGVSVLRLFVRQFFDPLIYILLFAAVISLAIGKFTDAGFIFLVLMVNAIIGLVQEYSAQRSAASLDVMVTNQAKVIRAGESYEINAEALAPGDIVLLESGDKVPADLRLMNEQELRIDESLLSGESLPVEKNATAVLAKDALIQERLNMAFSGSLVIHGRATGVVTATGAATELGKIAQDVLLREKTKSPLIIRMEKFTWRLSGIMGVITLLIAAIVLYQGMPWMEVLLLSAALVVAAIPEGLPVAITIALAISIRRMAKRHVIARNLVAVEALGSCTFIATDKTGTLTRNEINVEMIALPGGQNIKVPVMGIAAADQLGDYRAQLPPENLPAIDALVQAVVLANEAFIGHRNGSWAHHGDSMDVALLIFGHNLGFDRAALIQQWQPLSLIPFESVRRYSASLHIVNEVYTAFAKGAVETVLEMSGKLSSGQPLDADAIMQQAHQMANKGYRVLAVARKEIKQAETQLHETELHDMTFLGLVGMIDPLRRESLASIEACHAAGIEVAMLTGDHPSTAYAIASQLKLVSSAEQILTSKELKLAAGDARQLATLVKNKTVYARLEPHQKLDIVAALQQSGHFVAMTGDGANDAPALRAAHVGVAMGKSGTAVARETADIILTDDNFSSIVAGVEEGRIAYSNVRKVIHLLISTGAGEIVLFMLSLLTGLPIPLTAVQLLWLNLVTNGIQDVALAFEPGEGNELNRPPRKPDERIFNRIMIERVLLAAVVIGGVSFICFKLLLMSGMSVEAARNGTLLLMIMFENIHVFNSRSETQSVFVHSPLRNVFVLLSVIGAQLVHQLAMYIPKLSEVLQIQPVSLLQWLMYLGAGMTLLLASEMYKQARARSLDTVNHA